MASQSFNQLFGSRFSEQMVNFINTHGKTLDTIHDHDGDNSDALLLKVIKSNINEYIKIAFLLTKEDMKDKSNAVTPVKSNDAIKPVESNDAVTSVK